MAPKTRGSIKNSDAKRIKKIIPKNQSDDEDEYIPEVLDSEQDDDNIEDDLNDEDSDFEPSEDEMPKRGKKSNNKAGVKRGKPSATNKQQQRNAKSSKMENGKRRKKSDKMTNGNDSNGGPESNNVIKSGADDDDDDEDDDDWEEVPQDDFDPDTYNPELPANLQIQLKAPTAGKKSTNKWDWIRQCIRCDINHQRKAIQLDAHRTHLLLYVYRLRYLNSMINGDLMKALIMSCEFFQNYHKPPTTTTTTKKPVITAEQMFELFQKDFKIFMKTTTKQILDIEQELISTFNKRQIQTALMLNLIMAALMRMFKCKVRLCYLLCPVPIKPLDLLTKHTKFVKNQEEPFPVVPSKIHDIHDCYWLEWFDPREKRWISVNFVQEIYDDPHAIVEKLAKKLKIIAYVLAIDNDGYINDVTQRYCRNWFSYDRIKNRIDGDEDDDWYETTMNMLKRPTMTVAEKADKLEFERMQANAEFPKRVADYKNHPLFALARHTLKFQAFYPPDLPPLGFFNDEPIYSRDCLYTLKSRETWLRDARTVMPEEKPYKMELSKFKKIKPFSNGEAERQPLELFGIWQTKPYEPPVAQNGVVPRNGFGNVDLFQPCMLPKGTVLLRLPGIARIAHKMNIDCAPAIVGFDNNKKGIGSHPIIDGFVVCEEFEKVLREAWERNNEIQQERNREDREKRIYGNWKRLIRSLIIRNNIKIKYGGGGDSV